jgi:hypothetical protein
MSNSEQTEHKIATAANDAIKVIANAAAEAVKVAAKSDGSDHDLIIKLDTKMDGLSDQIKTLDNNTTKRIDALEKDKLNARDSYAEIYKKEVDNRLDNAETRIGNLESSKTQITVLLSISSVILSTLIGLLIWHIFKTQ